jgi:DNA mismatch repair protein MutS2
MMQVSTETIENLEFPKVLDEISLKCVSNIGKARIHNSAPSSIIADVKDALIEVTEMKHVYVAEGGMPIWHFEDTRVLLRKIEPLSSYLEPADCQEIQNVLEIAREITKFFNKHADTYQILHNLADGLYTLENLRKKIENTIEPSGSIFDNASPELKRIRQEISAVSKQIHIKLERILKKQTEHLQEEYITLREGRLVVPVREFSVNKIPGIVHGQSATGQTHYVEPLSIVSMNNEISELYAQEKREIIAILKNISSEIRIHREELLVNLDILTHFDSLQARAQYSTATTGVAPQLNTDHVWNLNNAFHPLLLKKIGEEAVPLSLQIDAELRTIIITGPNAGGKTVALKTLGLLQVMVQCGIHVPVAESSSFPVCNQIFAVIGDEQSIENDLSTFSSHIQKLNTILNKLDSRSLVLIDEIGSGTDPAEGSALAVAFLEELQNPETVTVVTTHHGALKAYAQRAKGVKNAAMQFDRETLTPMFKLETGIPGSSYAFDISRRLGLNNRILERAKDIMGSSQHQLEEIILELSHVKQEYEKQLQQLSIKNTELEGLQLLYKQKNDELKKNKKQYDREAYEAAQQSLQGINREIENTIREIRESKASPEIIKKSKSAISKLREQVNRSLDTEEGQLAEDITLIKKGVWIKSKRFGMSGQISNINHDKMEVEIEAKGVKVFVPFDDLTIIDMAEHQPQNQSEYSNVSVTSAFYEIDLRGKLAEEAVLELENYLDQAISSEWHQVRIIHGKGTGALRQKIHAYLKRNSMVKSFRLGRYGEGDAGVTIVEI